MSNEHVMQSLRTEFFDERTDAAMPLKKFGWRGCVLDRDLYPSRLPRVLWEGLIKSVTSSTVEVCRYSSEGDRCEEIPASWEDFVLHLKNNYSPEYFVCDHTRQWALLADVDVTTLGMNSELAEAVDQQLDAQGTSLKLLTMESFSSDEIDSERGSYIRGVLGS